MIKRFKKEPPHELTPQERELFLNAFYQGDIPKAEHKTNLDNHIHYVISHGQVFALDADERELFLSTVDADVAPRVIFNKEEKNHEQKRQNYAKKRNILDGVIDLHGMYAQDALFALNTFLEKEKKRGSKTVLVIHGKGSGVLRNTVLSFIKSHTLVDDFQVASGKLGGSGAIIVRLNRKRSF